MNRAPSVPRGRLAFIDWLRFPVVLSLAPFHAALSFTGMGSVYVYDTPVRDILLAGGTPVNIGPGALTVFTVFMDNWFMHLLFFISGIGAVFSLRKRSGAQFMGERSTRLLLPFFLGTLLVVSFQTWLGALSFGRFSGSFFAFFPLFFSEHFNWGHLWFLLYLFVFSALALPLFLSIRQKGEGSRFLSAARLATYLLVAVPDGYNAANITAHAFRGIAAYGLVIAVVGYAQCYLNEPGRMMGIARDLSFRLYILHYAPLTAATYLLLNSGLSIWTRWILAVAASWSFVALFTYLARFAPLLRDFFSIRPPAVRTS